MKRKYFLLLPNGVLKAFYYDGDVVAAFYGIYCVLQGRMTELLQMQICFAGKAGNAVC